MSAIAQTATLVHGFTMADVDRAAHIAAAKMAWINAIDREEREQTAWHGVVEYLYDCGCGFGVCNRPAGVTFHELLFAGMDAIRTELGNTLRHHGQRPDPAGGYEDAPNFLKYWLPVRKSKYWDDDGFSDHLCEKMALATALATLTPRQYEAIATLAAFDNDAGAAAAALGAKYHAFMYHVYTARRRIAQVWFEDEQPPTSKPTGETCRVGHSRAEHGVQKPDGAWTCRACKRASDRRWHLANRQQRVVDEIA